MCIRDSPWVAGMMSVVIPGSGKIYAGKTGQGIITFIQNVALGVQAYEAYRRDGWKSPRFLIYGGLFSFFYVGNVWGCLLYTSRCVYETGVDLVTGLIVLCVTFISAMRLKVHAKNLRRIEICTTYWHLSLIHI